MNERGLAKTALLISNGAIADGVYAMEITSPDLASAARPGQFVMLAITDGVDPFLRRPFGIAGIDEEKGDLRLVYQTVGRGTRQMSTWAPERELDLLGPLGNGFSYEDSLTHTILVGGGMGMAPLFPLAKALRSQSTEVTVFIGVRTRNMAFDIQLLSDYGCQVELATEDGSGGAPGFVTSLLEKRLKTDTSPGVLYACGPTPMLQAVAALCDKYGCKAQLSLEERMGCGTGACMGCSIPVKTADGTTRRKRVCHDGPVFDVREVLFHG